MAMYLLETWIRFMIPVFLPLMVFLGAHMAAGDHLLFRY